MYDLGSRLKAVRLQRGLTQKTLARRINKSISAVSSYESNAQMPPLDVLETLSSVLNVSLDYLVGLENYNLYSTKALTKEQKDFIDLLFREFTSAKQSCDILTQQQVLIIQKLFQLFTNKNEKE